VLTPSPAVPDSVMEAFDGLVSLLGARTVQMDPETHDRVAAAVSHLPQMMATALVGMVGRLNEVDGHHLRMAAGGFRDLTRIASSPYGMWRDICRTNADDIREMIDAYILALGELRDRLGDEDLASHFEFANRVRDSIPKDSKGFLHPLCEVLLQVEDQPGVLAGVSARLAEADININDIEVLKVREGEGGTIRMGFDTREIAQRAIEALSADGYKVRIR
jgi:prephenate dehydrogenase